MPEVKDWTPEDQANMTEEQAFAILAPYLKNSEQVAKERAERDAGIAQIVDEAERRAAEAKARAEDLKAGLDGKDKTPTPPGPVICPNCHKPAFIIDKSNGFKVKSFKTGKTIMDFPSTVQMIGNSFGFKCSCGKNIEVIT